jgi:hypothetical protein
MADNQDNIKRKAQETASIVEDALSSIASQIGSIFNQALEGADRVTKATARDLQASFNKFAKITDDIASNLVKIEQGSLTVKNIQSQINARKAQELSLGIKLVTNLRQQGVQAENIDDLIEKQNAGTLSLTKKQKQLVSEYLKAKGFNEDYTTELEKQQKLVEAQNKKLGITGNLVKGISKIPVLGNLIDAEAASTAAQEESARKGSTRFSVMAKTAGAVGKSLAGSLTDPLFIITQIFDIFKGIDSGAGELAKGMNMSYREALAFRDQLGEAAKNANDVAVTTKRNQESYMAISQALGANADINEKELKTFTKLREQAGYTNDELVSMQKMSLVTGKTLEDTTKEFLGGAEALSAQKGLAINVKQLMKETANVSNATKLSLVGGAKGLAEAAVAAKALGVDLGKVSDISGKLLNFEDSISAELEAELLTGKQINLETARLAALNGDMATVAEEIKNQIGGSAEFSKMNRIQQEAFANAVGMSREELANSLVEQEALQKVGAKTAEEAKKKYDDLISRGLTAEQAAVELGDQQLAKQFEQQNLQERFNQTIEKLKDTLSTLVDGPLGSFMAGLADLLNNAEVLKGIFIAIGTIITTRMVASLATGLVSIVASVAGARAYNQALNQNLGKEAALTAMKVAGAEASTLGAATIPIIAGLTAVMAAAAGFAMLNDGAVDPNGGLVVSKPKGGLVAQYNKDDYIVGTTNRPGTGGSGGGGIDYDRLATAMAKVNVTPVVNLDGRKISDNTTTNTNISAVKQQ